jgi:hypothetical protein
MEMGKGINRAMCRAELVTMVLSFLVVTESCCASALSAHYSQVNKFQRKTPPLFRASCESNQFRSPKTAHAQYALPNDFAVVLLQAGVLA